MTDLIATLPALQRWSPLRPSSRQLRFLLDDRPALLYGGAAAGGKSVGLMMSALQHVDHPHYRALLARETLAELRQPGALIDLSHQWLDRSPAAWRESRLTWEFPSGARIEFGHLAEHNYRRYLGTQWHLIAIDECTSVAPDAIRELRTRLRRSVSDPLPLRFRAATNPGGPYHDWWHEHYVDRGLLVGAAVADNPGIDAAEYLATLRESTTAARYAQLAEGDWESHADESASWDESDIIYLDPPPDSEMMALEIGVDPSAAGGDTADECGIVLAGVMMDGRVIVLEDHSMRARPSAWAAVVTELARSRGATVRVEGNLAGFADRPDLLAAPGHALQTPRVTGTKQTRHIATAVRCRRGEIVFARDLRDGPLVRQMLSWAPPRDGRRARRSPDRIDAMVMATRSERGVVGVAMA